MTNREQFYLIDESEKAKERIKKSIGRARTRDELNSYLLVRASLNDIDTMLANKNGRTQFAKVRELLRSANGVLGELESHFNAMV